MACRLETSGLMTSSEALIAEIPHLRRYARALLREHGPADDLVQSCLERALSRFHLWQRDRALRPWLFTIMHNLYVNSIRHRARRPALMPLEHAAATPARTASQDVNLEVRRVMMAIDQLPEEQRAVLLLIGIEELSYNEAATVLGIPTGTLMSRLHRGRQRLRDILDMPDVRPMIRQAK